MAKNTHIDQSRSFPRTEFGSVLGTLRSSFESVRIIQKNNCLSKVRFYILSAPNDADWVRRDAIGGGFRTPSVRISLALPFPSVFTWYGDTFDRTRNSVPSAIKPAGYRDTTYISIFRTSRHPRNRVPRVIESAEGCQPVLVGILQLTNWPLRRPLRELHILCRGTLSSALDSLQASSLDHCAIQRWEASRV